MLQSDVPHVSFSHVTVWSVSSIVSSFPGVFGIFWNRWASNQWGKFEGGLPCSRARVNAGIL